MKLRVCNVVSVGSFDEVHLEPLLPEGYHKGRGLLLFLAPHGTHPYVRGQEFALVEALPSPSSRPSAERLV